MVLVVGALLWGEASSYSSNSALATSIAYAVFIWRARELSPESDAQPLVGFSLLVHYAIRLCVSVFWFHWFRVLVDLALVMSLLNAARVMASKAGSPKHA